MAWDRDFVDGDDVYRPAMCEIGPFVVVGYTFPVLSSRFGACVLRWYSVYVYLDAVGGSNLDAAAVS